MVNRPMLWAAENPRLQRAIHDSKLFQPIVHRLIAGDELEDALAAARELNAHGIGGSNAIPRGPDSLGFSQSHEASRVRFIRSKDRIFVLLAGSAVRSV
jgi:hypothetical protein